MQMLRRLTADDFPRLRQFWIEHWHGEEIIAQGIGSEMIEAVIKEAKIMQCQRVFVITTNDNLHALGFYQKCGFSLVAIHRHAMEESRKRKPTIPWIGENGIPLRDEIELELWLE